MKATIVFLLSILILLSLSACDLIADKETKTVTKDLSYCELYPEHKNCELDHCEYLLNGWVCENESQEEAFEINCNIFPDHEECIIPELECFEDMHQDKCLPPIEYMDFMTFTNIIGYDENETEDTSEELKSGIWKIVSMINTQRLNQIDLNSQFEYYYNNFDVTSTNNMSDEDTEEATLDKSEIINSRVIDREINSSVRFWFQKFALIQPGTLSIKCNEIIESEINYCLGDSATEATFLKLISNPNSYYYDERTTNTNHEFGVRNEIRIQNYKIVDGKTVLESILFSGYNDRYALEYAKYVENESMSYVIVSMGENQLELVTSEYDLIERTHVYQSVNYYNDQVFYEYMILDKDEGYVFNINQDLDDSRILLTILEDDNYVMNYQMFKNTYVANDGENQIFKHEEIDVSMRYVDGWDSLFMQAIYDGESIIDLPVDVVLLFDYDERSQGPLIQRDFGDTKTLTEENFSSITDDLTFNGVTYNEFKDLLTLMENQEVVGYTEDTITFNSVVYNISDGFEQMVYDNLPDWMPMQIEELLYQYTSED